MTDLDGWSVPNSVAKRDLAALVGLLATLEAELLAGEVGPHLAGRLARQLIRDGLLTREYDLGRALGGLNQRLRYAIGEHPEAPR